MTKRATSRQLVFAGALLLLAVLGTHFTLNLFWISATATSCNWTACDQPRAVAMLPVALGVLLPILAVGLAISIYAMARRLRDVVAYAGFTLFGMFIACFIIWSVYMSAGTVNP